MRSLFYTNLAGDDTLVHDAMVLHCDFDPSTSTHDLLTLFEPLVEQLATAERTAKSLVSTHCINDTQHHRP